jgi:NAD(P)-dependent dehydrogenase (short-subunit alcohol dehydrogenase family)
MGVLEGKRAIVTGANKGIGLACKNALEKEGALVYPFNRFDGNDVRDEKSIENFLQKVGGKIDILINNAGVTGKDWDQTMDTNVKGAYLFSEQTSKMMSINGSIINISSIASIFGFPNNPQYVASKAALNGLTRALAFDYSKNGIRVNAIALGYFKTDMTSKSWESEKRRKLISSHTLFNRWGSLEEIEGPIIFLASKASSFVTGQVIFVDGGWSCRGITHE